MRAYDIVLFIHLLGVITWFIAIGLIQGGGARVRGAQTIEELRLWLGLVRTTRPMFPSATVILLVSGMYLTNEAWSFSTPWVVVAIVSLVAMALVGTLVVGRGMARIGAAAATAPGGPIQPDLARIIADPAPWSAISALNGAALGILWLMATKPGWGVSIGVVVALALIGGIVGTAMARRAPTPATTGPS